MSSKIILGLEINSLDETKAPFAKKNIRQNVETIFGLLFKNKEILENSCVFRYDAKKINIELSFCNDNTIQEINRDYREKDRPTDVITFALFVDDNSRQVFNATIDLGEIIISKDTLKKQAKENAHSIEKELYTLITHGLLHLLGFDHLTQKDYDFVVSIQNEIEDKL